MSTNYFFLKFNEAELMKKFYKYWDHAVKMHELVDQFLQNFPNSVQNMDSFDTAVLTSERQSNKMHAELIDDAIWIISKDQPHASHLRFIIAIVSASFDLERICDYANNIRKFLISYKSFPEQLIDPLRKIFAMEIKIFYQIFLFFQNNSALDSYEFAQQKEAEFKQTFSECVKEMKQSFLQRSVDLIVELILALKYTERTIDHTIDIIQKFVYIKNYDFFFHH